MITEFPIEWEGFTASERQRLKTKWSKIQFPPEFTAKFQGSIAKGEPGGDGMFHFEAKDLKFFHEHFSGGIGFSDIDELITLAHDLATTFYSRLVEQGVLPQQ